MEFCKLISLAYFFSFIFFALLIYRYAIKSNNKFFPQQTLIAAGIICALFFLLALLYKCQEIPIELVTAIITISVAISSFTLKNDINAYKFHKTFIREINDIKRHLLSGVRVLTNIYKNLENGKKPLKVHFDNLIIPEDITLVNNKDQASIDVIEKTNLMRIRLNLRNINNVAKFMGNYVDNPNYKEDELKKIIEWEIIRYFRKIMILEYLTTKSLEYPDKTTLEEYISNLSFNDQTYCNIYHIFREISTNSRIFLKQRLKDSHKDIILFDN